MLSPSLSLKQHILSRYSGISHNLNGATGVRPHLPPEKIRRSHLKHSTYLRMNLIPQEKINFKYDLPLDNHKGSG